MKAATVIILFTIVGASVAYFIDDQYDGWNDGDQGVAMSSVKRRGGRGLCLPWRAPCPADSSLIKKYKFLRCCGSLSCSCTIWGNNCKCENKVGK